MKTLLLTTVLASCALISSMAFAKNIHVTLDGVVCSSCVGKTKKAISKIDKKKVVESVEVDYKNLSFDIKTKGEGDLDDQQIKDAIQKKGYTVKEITRS